jgi:hypothetical protein
MLQKQPIHHVVIPGLTRNPGEFSRAQRALFVRGYRRTGCRIKSGMTTDWPVNP